MNYSNTIKYIESANSNKLTPGNRRLKKVMKLFSNPQDDLHCIHVAGTNGKGSCCAFLTSILIDAGYKVGTFISPHLIKYEERISINNVPISCKDFCRLVDKVKNKAKKINVKLTTFEILTAICFIYFKEKNVDIVVLEVGLGGRLDATNIIKKSELSVLMNIGLEHTEILGDTLSKIAYEKACIIKNKSNVVAYNNSKCVIDVFKSVAKEKNANLNIVNFKKIKERKMSLKGQIFDYGDLKNIKLSLIGKHQYKNASVAIEACLLLSKMGYHITKSNIKNGLNNTKWNARFSILSTNPLFILDGAHNPQCSEALYETLYTLFNNKKIIFLFGMLKDKDYKRVIKTIIPLAKEFVCITPSSNRSLSSKELASILSLKKQKASSVDTIEEGIKLALNKAKKNDIIVAFGSLYLAGTISSKFDNIYKRWIKEQKNYV